MFNNVIGKLDNFFADVGQGGGGGSGSHQQQFSSPPPSKGGDGGGGMEQRPEDIPREELLHLCMKMNTRMKTMESKYKELSKKKSSLSTERQSLLQYLEMILQCPLLVSSSTVSTASSGNAGGAPSHPLDPLASPSPANTSASAGAGTAGGEADLDLAYIQQKVIQYQQSTQSSKQSYEDRIRQYEREIMELQNKNKLLTAMMNSSTATNNTTTANNNDNVPAVNSGGEGNDHNLIDLSNETATNSTSDNNNNMNALVELNNSLQQQLVTMQMDQKDYNSKLQRYEIEQQRLTTIESYLKDQVKSMETVILTKNEEIETLRKEKEQIKVQYEEKLVYVTMQLQQCKAKYDDYTIQQQQLMKSLEEDKLHVKCEYDSLLTKMRTIMNHNEEKEILLVSNKEMIIALQQRLLQVEPEVVHFKERSSELEKHVQMMKVMKYEQDNLISALQKDIKTLQEEKQQSNQQQDSMQEMTNKLEAMTNKLTHCQDMCTKLQEENEEKNGIILRLRSEASITERNYAMKTAMLATCEAQIEDNKETLTQRDQMIKDFQQQCASLQQQVHLMEQRLTERMEESNQTIEALEKEKKYEQEQSSLLLEALKQEHVMNLENIKKDYSKKSAMARQLLSEREEEVRILSSKVKELQEEISSGAPTDRKILELAKEQSKRDSMNSLHRDNREVAFQQLQRTLAVKDFELAQCQQRVSDLNNEVSDLRKIKQREGINMDYLKNVVFQYMTLSAQSSERQALVPVLAMLLQFNAKEMAEVQKALKDPNYGMKPVKEVKRVDFSNLFSFGSTSSTSAPTSPARSPGVHPSGADQVFASSNVSSTRPPLPPSMRIPPSPEGGLRKNELSMSDQDLHQKLTKIGGDILDMSMSNDDVDSANQSIISPHGLSDDGLFSKAL